MNLDKVKTDGKKQTEEKKQVLKEEVLAEEITELQSIGLLNDVDANKKPSEVLNSIKEVQMHRSVMVNRTSFNSRVRVAIDLRTNCLLFYF